MKIVVDLDIVRDKGDQYGKFSMPVVTKYHSAESLCLLVRGVQ
jgi:hypothetical protein